MSQPYILAYLPWCKTFEGNVATMYLDTVGNVTCGVGFLLETALVAQGYPWYIPGEVTLATAQEIAEEWDRVSAMQPGHLPPYYAALTALQLRQGDIDAHLLGEVEALDEQLAAKLPYYATLSGPWKMALLDMAWNRGLNGLLDGYPRLLADVEAGNGPGAASQCYRLGISQTRNDWTAAQFSGQPI